MLSEWVKKQRSIKATMDRVTLKKIILAWTSLCHFTGDDDDDDNDGGGDDDNID